MEGTKEFRMIINSIHIVIGLYLLSLTNGLDMIPLLPDTPEDYKKVKNRLCISCIRSFSI